MYLYSCYLFGCFGFVVVLFLRKCFMWQSLDLNSWFSCSHLPGAGIRGMCQHMQLFKSASYSKAKSSRSKLRYYVIYGQTIWQPPSGHFLPRFVHNERPTHSLTLFMQPFWLLRPNRPSVPQSTPFPLLSTWRSRAISHFSELFAKIQYLPLSQSAWLNGQFSLLILI